MLNNREIATIAWLSILLLWSLTQPRIRSAYYQVLKSFFAKAILKSTLYMLLYIVLLVIAFAKTGFWDESALKDTILWTIGVAFPMLIKSNEAANSDEFLGKTVSRAVAYTVLLEFVVSLYSFPLVAELLFVPVVAIVAAMSGYAEVKSEYQRVRPVLNGALAVFGIVVLVFTIHQLVVDFQGFASLRNLRDLLLPPLLTIAFLPFMYFMALYLKYDWIFMWINLRSADRELARYAKKRVFAANRLNLKKLRRFSKNLRMPRLLNKEDVDALFSSSRQDVL